MNSVTHSRPAAELHLDDRTDHERLYKALDNAIPPVPTDTPHDEVFVKSLKLAVEELQLRLCEANIDSVEQHPLSLWALRTCIELLREQYVLCIHYEEGSTVYAESHHDGSWRTFTDADPTPSEATWEMHDGEPGMRSVARENRVSFVRKELTP